MSSGFTLVEVVVVTGLLLVFSLALIPMVQMSDTRDDEDRLRETLVELRGALDSYQQHTGNYPTSFQTLLTTSRPDGGFYLRRFPINPLIGTSGWEISARTSREGTGDIWIYIGSAPSTIIDGMGDPQGIVDIRASTGTNIATTGINAIPYRNW